MHDLNVILFSYINREDVDFDTVEGYTATQEWELVQSPDVVEYQTRYFFL